jgi:hypothetical protein
MAPLLLVSRPLPLNHLPPSLSTSIFLPLTSFHVSPTPSHLFPNQSSSLSLHHHILLPHQVTTIHFSSTFPGVVSSFLSSLTILTPISPCLCHLLPPPQRPQVLPLVDLITFPPSRLSTWPPLPSIPCHTG